MIFSKFKYLAVFFAASLLISGCAQEPSESSRDAELRLLNSTKETFFPNATPLGGYTDGSLWLISQVPRTGFGDTPKNGDYVAFEYTGRVLPISGSYVFQTTDSTLSRQLGTFKYDTHFAPVFMKDTSSTSNQALYEALKIMRVGDTDTIMSASWLAFPNGTSGVNGNLGSLAANTPIIFTVTLKEIAPDPKKRELDMVKNFVENHPDFVPAKDSLGNELTGFYISYADTVPLDTAHHYAITGDSVFVKYAGYYLQDNFLLDANIDSVAKKHNRSITTTDSTYFDYVYTADASNTNVIKAFHYAVHRVAPGSWVEFVFTSDYGYGAEVNSRNSTRMIYPYTPLRYRIYVAKNNRR